MNLSQSKQCKRSDKILFVALWHCDGVVVVGKGGGIAFQGKDPRSISNTSGYTFLCSLN